MRKVLIVLSNLAINNGVASCIMNNYHSLLKTGNQVDFLVLKEVQSIHEKNIKENRGNIYILPDSDNRKSSEKTDLVCKILSNHYDIVHVNIPYYNGSYILKCAKKAGVKVRIYHSHNPKRVDSWKARLYSEFYTPQCVHFANAYIACSTIAGDTVFGKRKYHILHNAIYAEKYVFDEISRNKLRKAYDLSDKFVVGVVGRIDEQKNPYFIMSIIENLYKLNQNIRLVWLGAGNLEDDIRRCISEKNLESVCHLLGSRTDVNKWYSAMDLLLFPSKFEGLGMVLIEAQTSGLMCYASDCVPRETKVTELVHFKALSDSPEAWAKEIMLCSKRKINRKSRIKEINESGYNIAGLRDNLVNLYDEFMAKYQQDGGLLE